MAVISSNTRHNAKDHPEGTIVLAPNGRTYVLELVHRWVRQDSSNFQTPSVRGVLLPAEELATYRGLETEKEELQKRLEALNTHQRELLQQLKQAKQNES